MVNIQLNDTVAAALTAQAQSQGLSLEDYLAVLAQKSTGKVSDLTVEEFDRMLDELSLPPTKYTGTFPRSEIYRDHD